MRIVFMGTPEPAANILAALLKTEHQIVGVVTQPDRPYGRGLRITVSPVKEVAREKSIPLMQPNKISDGALASWIKNLKADSLIVVAYGKILPAEILSLPKYGALNVHASLLPKYRGAAPIQWALLNGEKESGVTIMKIDAQLDTGDILLQEKVTVLEEDNAGTLAAKIFAAGEKLLLTALAAVERGTAQYVKQNNAFASYAPSLTKESGEIDWKKTAMEVHNRIRALVTWPGAHTFFRQKQLKILASKLQVPVLAASGQPGEIIQIIKQLGFVVACGSGNLLITSVQLEGKKRMSAGDFVNGHDVEIGETLPN
jgi:methionyl-tRNA formyltransferase